MSQLKEMGFEEAQVRKALRAAFGNTERAADFLMSGSIPASALAAADAAARGGPGGGAAAAGGGGPLAQLRGHPQINGMRRLVRGNPGAVQALLAQIGSQNPALLALITANQDEFIAILNEPIDDDGEDDDEGSDAMGEDDEGDEEGGMAGMRELMLLSWL